MAKPLTWGLVVESDEIYSPKTKHWYEVRSSVIMLDGRIKLSLKGVPKPVYRDASATVPAAEFRRGKTGRVVDLFAVVFSGQTRPDAIGMGIRGDMLGEKPEGTEDE